MRAHKRYTQNHKPRVPNENDRGNLAVRSSMHKYTGQKHEAMIEKATKVYLRGLLVKGQHLLRGRVNAQVADVGLVLGEALHALAHAT